MSRSPRHRYILLAVLGYLALALTWILISDQLLSAYANVESMLWLSTAKGIFFVLTSAAIFYFVLRSVPARTDPHATLPGETLIDSLTTGLWPRWLSYLFAVALVGIAFIVRVNLHAAFAGRPLLIIFVLPIILAALLGGFGPGLVATCLSGFAGFYLLAPHGAFIPTASHDLFQWGLLVVSGLTLSLTSEAMRRARNRERLRARQCDLANTALQESEARYRELFQANPLPMWVYDLETLAFLTVNDAAVAHYGYSHDEFLAMTIRDIRPVEDVPRLLENIAGVGEGLDEAGVWRHRKKDGSLIDVEIRSHTLVFNGRRAEMVLANDVTERKCMEAALAESEKRHRTLFENSLDAILLTIPDGRILSANPAACLIFGRSEEEIRALGRGGVVDTSDPNLEKLLEERSRSGKAFGELTFLRKDGSRFPAEISSVLFRDSAGEPRSSMIIRDVTERKRADQERQELINELKKRNAELERFTYTVSHDLKSPLVTILGFIGQLRQDLTDNDRENVEADLGFIGGAANQMSELLDNLLQLSRAGRAIGEPEPIDLALLAREALQQLSEQLTHATVRIDIPPELPPLLGDPLRLREVFQNLLENAAKYTVDQSEPSVEIGASTGNGEVVCFVRDNGIGIPADYQEKIFGLFEQLDPGSGGTGVGLAIVRRIVEEHGGRVWVESAGEGQGSTFFFTLPLAGFVGVRSP